MSDQADKAAEEKYTVIAVRPDVHATFKRHIANLAKARKLIDCATEALSLWMQANPTQPAPVAPGQPQDPRARKSRKRLAVA